MAYVPAEPCFLRDASKGSKSHTLGIKDFILTANGEHIESRMRREVDEVRKRQEQQHGTTLRTHFRMGHGQETWDPVDGAEFLLNREMPEVASNLKGQSGQHIVPPFFISDCPSAVDYDKYPQKFKDLKDERTPEEAKNQGFSEMKTGEPTEKKVYDKLTEYIQNTTDEVTLFHGAKFVLTSKLII